MCRYRKVKKIVALLSLLAVASGIPAFSAQSAPTSGTWQVTKTSTGEVEGTSPQADSATIAVYQGSVQLDPAKTHPIPYSATPGDFSADAAPGRLILTNPRDTEGDLFAAPPDLQWENQQVPGAELVWADTATPDTPLDPQPVVDKSFCAQNLAGRHLVVWPQVVSSTTPPLYLSTLTGTPTTGTIPLQDQRVAIDIASAENDPLTVSASQYDGTLKAAKVKVGETITLTITTHDCAGNTLGNTGFVITRSDATGRQGDVNNDSPVQVGSTELTTADTVYHGVTDASGTATVTVTQNNGPGVKTTLKVMPSEYSTLEEDVDVIFTTLTSPDSDKAAMWGHMAESTTVGDFTFSRPKLSGETNGTNGAVTDHNESWALFDWSNANSHCNTLLPDLRRLVALDAFQGTQTVQDTLGWPIQGDYYWSSSPGESGWHYAVDMHGQASVSSNDSKHYLVSCVDHAIPAAIPKITLTPDHFDTTLNAAKVMTSESITMTVEITDSVTGEPLPYTYYTLQLGAAQNRAKETNAEWENSPVVITGEHIQESDPHLYQGITDASGEATVVLTQPQGAGVRTPITAGMREGYTAEDSKDVIFTVITSPDSENARMWGHMKNGVVVDGDAFVRPLLASEAVDSTGSYSENNESWATFDVLVRAQQQCGEGELPSVNSLQSLYAAYPDKKLETEKGWPTDGYSYLAADTDGTTYHNVSLNNGDQGNFTDRTPNYLSCAATELVAQLQVTTNGDATQRLAKAKVGETVTLMVQTTNAVNGQPAPAVAFSVTSAASTNRQGSATGFSTGGPLIVNGQSFGTSGITTGTYQGVTDDQGQAQLVIEQPKGAGLKTPLTIKLVDSRVADPINYEVIFTAVTSPDSDKALMWGHMDDSLTVGSDTFYRPKLASEFSSPPASTNTSANEVWGRLDHPGAMSSAAGGCETGHLPSSDQLLALYSANKDNKINTEHGWPVSYYYWSSTLVTGTSNNWYGISMTPGTANSAVGTNTNYVSCLKDATRTAAQITLETVDNAQWSATLNAARVKKDDTLQIKLTTRDDAGNPAPNTPVVLSRGDDYLRQVGGRQRTPSPMVINGQTLSSTSSVLNVVTGADGTLMLTVTRANTAGTKAAIVAKLFANTSVTASMDTIFTVVTSPDSAKAVYWGHMPETLTAADGTVFKRPLLFDELSQKSNFLGTTENNETWALFDWNQTQNSSASGCGGDSTPNQAALDSLYNANPGGEISSTQGWPAGKNYWSSTADTNQQSSRYYKSVNLKIGTSASEVLSQARLLSCLHNKKPLASQLELSSAQYVADPGAAKTPKGSKVTMLVMTKDAQGIPVPYTAFTLARGMSTNRAGSNVSSSLRVGLSGGTAMSMSSSTKFFGTTDASGQALLDISQDDTTGLETPVIVTLDSDTAVTKTMPVIFTVITSPDSTKAAYWGHMPETFTASNGAEFSRPLLYDEYPAAAATSNYTTAGEKWPLTTSAKMDSGACPRDQMPVLSDLQSLYTDHPDGNITTDLGLPTNNSWWAGDEKATGLTALAVNYQYLNMRSGAVGATASTSTPYAQICLTKPRGAQFTVTFPAEKWDVEKQATVVEINEKTSATVAVTDASGKPIPGILVRVSPGAAFNRQGASAGTISKTVTETAPVQATGWVSTDGFYNGITGDDGKAVFEISQASSASKATLTFSVDTVSGTKTQDFIATIHTSPDSPYAQNWGSMAETIEVNGVTYKRPILMEEYGTPAAGRTMSGIKLSGETWATFTPTGSSHVDVVDACGSYIKEDFPAAADVKAMYSDGLVGSGAAAGWPYAMDGSTSGRYLAWNANLGSYQLVDMSFGAVTTATINNNVLVSCPVR